MTSRISTALVKDERGVVYLEFLLSFMPLFLLFLAIGQYSLIATGRLVVDHAAYLGARSAIVILEDEPSLYGNSARGTLGTRTSASGVRAAQSLSALGLAPPVGGGSVSSRFDAISAAVELGLLSLAKSSRGDSLLSAFRLAVDDSPKLALRLTHVATSITLHAKERDETPVTESFDRKASVSVRVVYLMQCRVPLVRNLMCRSLSKGGLLAALSPEKTLDTPESAALTQLLGQDARFYRLESWSTLTNQGADYEPREQP